MARFLIGDLHFCHNNIVKFKNETTGEKVRPWDTIEEHDEGLIERWNSVVTQRDRVYVLGDVSMPRRGIKMMERLNGSKVLIKGNHDVFKLQDYTPYFKDIRAAQVDEKHRVVITHIPVHPQCLDRWRVNIHGHLHTEFVKTLQGNADPRYTCVSAEHIDFTPIEYDTAIKMALKKAGYDVS